MGLKRETRTIAVDDTRSVSSVWAVPDGFRPEQGAGVILAHGAGNDMDHPFLSYVHHQLAVRGFLSLKFNFPYKEEGRRAPDRAPVLEATWQAVIESLRQDPLAPAHLFLAGKSLGGRMASHLAARGEPCDGLILLGYPLHPARRPERLRSDHLKAMTCPMLFVEGTRDPLCDLDLLARELLTVSAPVTVHRIEGGDHSFKVPKRNGRLESEVWEEIVMTVADWMVTVQHRA